MNRLDRTWTIFKTEPCRRGLFSISLHVRHRMLTCQLIRVSWTPLAVFKVSVLIILFDVTLKLIHSVDAKRPKSMTIAVTVT